MQRWTQKFVRAGRAWMLGLLTGSVGLAAAAAPGYQVQTAPAWVRPLPVSGQEAPGKAVGGVDYLLVDQQTRITANERQAFRHYARRVVTDKGLADVGSFSFDFDPSYQALTLHSLNVWRDGKASSRLRSSRIKLLERETDLEQRIYDGGKTVAIAVEDLRVGDVLEWSFTLTGWNPVFKNRQHGFFDLQWGVPVARQQARLLLPQDRNFFFKLQRSQLQARQGEFEGQREYVWAQQNLPALAREAELPRWFDPYPFVEWSEHASWAEVARWADELYTPPATLDPALQAVVDRLSLPEPTERMLAALRLVQQQVRYLSVSIGPGSHAPRPPAQVLRQRFGDCKDKALLTVTLLRALGIEASVALVNTGLREQLAERLPSPGRFDHAIVRARIGATDYWLDPTSAPQMARLNKLAQSDHGLALVLDGKSRELTAMPASKGRLAKRVIHVLFDSSAGLDKPSSYRISTVYHGAAADSQRAILADDDGEKLQRDCLNYYARYYPGIEVAAPMQIHDDVRANQITITEHYSIKQLWEHDDKAVDTASLHGPEMLYLLRKPESRIRTGPLAITHPTELDLVLEQRLPPGHKRHGQRSEFKLEDPHFEYEKSVVYGGEKVEVAHYFRSRADHVDAAQLDAYIAKLARAHDSVGIDLTLDPNAPQQALTPPAEPLELDRTQGALLSLVVGLGLGLAGLAAYRLHQAMQGEGAHHERRARHWTLGLTGLIVPSLVGLVLLLQARLVEIWPVLPPSLLAGLALTLSAGWMWQRHFGLRAPASAETPGSPPQP